MNYSRTIALLLWLGCLDLLQARPATIPKTPNHNSSVSTNSHETFKKSMSHSSHKGHGYHDKSHKRHLRKKKQFIIAGFGAGLAAGVPAYGLGYGGFSTSNNQLGYASPNTDPYGLAAYGAGAQGSMLSSSLSPSNSDIQSRQSLLSSFNGATGQGLGNYDTTGLSSYSNGGMDANALQNSVPSLGYNSKLTNDLASELSSSLSNGMTTGLSNSFSNGLSNGMTTGLSNSLSNGLSNGMSTGLSNGMTTGLSNSLSNGLSNSFNNGFGNSLNNGLSNSLGNGLSNSLSNGLSNGVTSYTGNDANQVSSLNGLSSLLSQSTTNDLGNAGGKYAAESLSAGLDSPNGIANIASLLNSASTAFDTDSQGQIANAADLNKIGQRFGNQGLAGQQVLSSQQGFGRLGQQSSTAAEVQAFENQMNHLSTGNQLNHLSTGKLRLGGNTHAGYGGYGDNMDSNNLNEIGQIASTGISDSSLQKILGQLMAGQFGHSNHGSSSQSTAGMSLPSDTGIFDTGNSEGLVTPQSETLDDQQGILNPLIEPVIHGQTIHAHASDKPKYHDFDDQGKGTSSASQKAFTVQMKANREHQLKLKSLKERLRMLREKLHKLKQEYGYGDADDSDNEITSDLTEKSELDTLDDLQKATEDAIKELKKQMSKIARRKGSNSDANGRKKGETLGDLETEMLELIDDDSQKKPNKKTKKTKHEDDHPTLTELEKQAEQEVDYLTKKNPKVIKKKQPLKLHHSRHSPVNPGLHIHIPEPVDEEETHPRISKSKKGESKLHGVSFRKHRHRFRLKSIKYGSKLKDDNREALGSVRKHFTAESHYNHVGHLDVSNETMRARHSLGFFSIGCWRDQPERALTSLEGIFPILDGNDYMRRKYAVRKCAQVARVQGFSAFAIENGGHCLAGKNVLQTYSMYGPSRGCKQDGRGGPWSMEVYKFTATSINPKNRRGDILRAMDPDDVKNIFYKGNDY